MKSETSSRQSLADLLRVRAGAALSLIAYLKRTAEDADTLPSYFPDRMLDGSSGWFTVVRQRVRVRNRALVVPRMERNGRPGADDAHGGAAATAPREGDDPDPEWGGAQVEAWHRIVVFGEPGAGKSWLLRFDELRLGLQWKDIDRQTTALDSVVLPIRVALADVAKAAAAPSPAPLTDANRAARVEDLLVATVRDRAAGMLTRSPENFTDEKRRAVEEDVSRFQGLETPPSSFDGLVRAAIDEGRALVMLDAWDEVPAVSDRHELARHVRAFASGFTGRLVLTSREAEFPKDDSPLPGAVLVELRPLVRSQVESFALAWFGEARQGITTNVITTNFIEQLDVDRGQVFELARNPLMLTLMCRLYEDARQPRPSGGEVGQVATEGFPRHRVEIYARCVRGLLLDWKKTWQARPGGTRPGEGYARDLTSVLARVAAALFTEQAPYPAERVAGLVRVALAELRERNSPGALSGFTEDAVLRSIGDDGVLMATDDRHAAYRFLHRTFQEYLAGVDLAAPAVDLASRERLNVDRAVARLAAALAARRSDPEVVLLALGYVGLVNRELPPSRGSEVAGGAIERLLDQAEPGDRFDVLALMGRAVAELGEAGVGRDASTRVTAAVRSALRGGGGDAARPVEPSWKRIFPWFRSPATARGQARQRVMFGDVLGRIGDTRFHGAERWHLPDDVACGWARVGEEDRWGFVKIPDGPVLMGSDKRRDAEAEDNELPQHRVEVPGFYVARWPVTEQQFGLFVRRTSYQAGTEWERGRPNHPVVHVSWHDGMAYCRWLLEEWQRERARLPQGLREAVDAAGGIGLPSEAEWERAARGDTGRIYPWGDVLGVERANYYETGIFDTSAVGCFPRGATPEGVEELGGNVEERTRSAYMDYPYDSTDGREDLTRNVHRVLRGGSSSCDRRGVRCACRSYYHFGFRFNLGFRVVLSPFRS